MTEPPNSELRLLKSVNPRAPKSSPQFDATMVPPGVANLTEAEGEKNAPNGQTRGVEYTAPTSLTSPTNMKVAEHWRAWVAAMVPQYAFEVARSPIWLAVSRVVSAKSTIEGSRWVGANEGVLEGDPDGVDVVGVRLGLLDGVFEGVDVVGVALGLRDGVREGTEVVGVADGLRDGLLDGERDGEREGDCDGLRLGLRDGEREGLREGLLEGLREGLRLGLRDGLRDGLLLGLLDGLNVSGGTQTHR